MKYVDDGNSIAFGGGGGASWDENSDIFDPSLMYPFAAGVYISAVPKTVNHVMRLYGCSVEAANRGEKIAEMGLLCGIAACDIMGVTTGLTPVLLTSPWVSNAMMDIGVQPKVAVAIGAVSGILGSLGAMGSMLPWAAARAGVKAGSFVEQMLAREVQEARAI